MNTARRLSGEFRVHSSLDEFREPYRATFPLLPQKRPEAPPCPVIKVSQHRWGLAVTELARPSLKIAAELFGHLLHAYPTPSSRQFPDLFLESLDRLRRDTPLRFAM